MADNKAGALIVAPPGKTVPDLMPHLEPHWMTQTALLLPGDLGQREWFALGAGFKRMASGWQWWWGDWLLFGQDKFPDAYAQALDRTEFTLTTLYIFVGVCRAFPPHRRRAGLSFGHHQGVASLPPDAQDRMLDLAESQGLSERQLRAAVKALRETADEKEHALSGGGDQGPPDEYLPIELPVTAESLYRVAEDYLDRSELPTLIEALGHLVE